MGSRLQPGEKVPIWAPRCCSPSTWQVAWEGQGHGLVGSQGLGEAVPFLCHSTSQQQQRFLPSLPAPTWKTWASCGPGLWSSDSQHQISGPQEPRTDPRRGLRPPVGEPGSCNMPLILLRLDTPPDLTDDSSETVPALSV